jgi:Domain of unknown function (DUF4386)
MSTFSEDDASRNVTARLAGALYSLIIVSGIFSEVFVRAKLVVVDDAETTVGNIIASDVLFRAGFVADTIMLIGDVAIAILFYVLLEPVSRNLAMSASVFRLIQAAVLAANMMNYQAVMMLIDSNSYGLGIDGAIMQFRVMMYLDMHANGYDLGLIFFAISSFMLGYLLIRSKIVPLVIGYGLVVAALVYLLGSYTRFMMPDLVTVIGPMYIIPFIAETTLAIWLLVKGIETGTGDKNQK